MKKWQLVKQHLKSKTVSRKGGSVKHIIVISLNLSIVYLTKLYLLFLYLFLIFHESRNKQTHFQHNMRIAALCKIFQYFGK